MSDAQPGYTPQGRTDAEQADDEREPDQPKTTPQGRTEQADDEPPRD